MNSQLASPPPGLHQPGYTLISLYFLVPAEHLDDFRKTFDEYTSRQSAKIRLSGPWPPYNFVTSLP